MKELTILKKALAANEHSLRYFEKYDAETDEEMKQIYWARSQKFDGKAEAYTDCYNILTYSKLLCINHELKNEMQKILLSQN